mmetsp:Transcript_12547/g.22789  ORF Transcript_12547/g.22789 Transcript_12547/m.22789 type:complete len:269 (+) Transcript_12547:424-1230(+)
MRRSEWPRAPPPPTGTPAFARRPPRRPTPSIGCPRARKPVRERTSAAPVASLGPPAVESFHAGAVQTSPGARCPCSLHVPYGPSPRQAHTTGTESPPPLQPSSATVQQTLPPSALVLQRFAHPFQSRFLRCFLPPEESQAVSGAPARRAATHDPHMTEPLSFPSPATLRQRSTRVPWVPRFRPLVLHPKMRRRPRDRRPPPRTTRSELGPHNSLATIAKSTPDKNQNRKLLAPRSPLAEPTQCVGVLEQLRECTERNAVAPIVVFVVV